MEEIFREKSKALEKCKNFAHKTKTFQTSLISELLLKQKKLSIQQYLCCSLHIANQSERLILSCFRQGATSY